MKSPLRDALHVLCLLVAARGPVSVRWAAWVLGCRPRRVHAAIRYLRAAGWPVWTERKIGWVLREPHA